MIRGTHFLESGKFLVLVGLELSTRQQFVVVLTAGVLYLNCKTDRCIEATGNMLQAIEFVVVLGILLYFSAFHTDLTHMQLSVSFYDEIRTSSSTEELKKQQSDTKCTEEEQQSKMDSV